MRDHGERDRRHWHKVYDSTIKNITLGTPLTRTSTRYLACSLAGAPRAFTGLRRFPHPQLLTSSTLASAPRVLPCLSTGSVPPIEDVESSKVGLLRASSRAGSVFWDPQLLTSSTLSRPVCRIRTGLDKVSLLRASFPTSARVSGS